ncbi:phosphatase PAP2 family protein [Chryseobacterium mucoviscidosis]|uniref:PA-phosphatase n=1 Tax=Chryseobacterium mucoviscidosis TaxID=1945581 RepID=A0A202BTL7_9FLAO|nr:phosphatase PAP2 family protein [Chryseobacterium mucoviscidosis]OVE54804.1 PA-phosphatase [Chryseobacterium mucoviscidosis]
MLSIKKNASTTLILVITLFLVLVNICFVSAQDTILNTRVALQDSAITINNDKAYKLGYKHLITPTVFIGFGIVSLESDGLKQLNSSTREEINEHQPDHISLDDYTQYAPAVMVYGLNAAGIKGKHNFRDRTIIYATSQLISAAFVVPLKHIVKEERPDSSNNLSFPSGHTATAFSSAQFMFREYKDTNFWLSISGYSFAVFTGVYRTLNDKHWVNDVVAGAGFGILSTELAYWLYPKINGLLSGKPKNATTMIVPFYQNKGFGIGFVKNF